MISSAQNLRQVTRELRRMERQLARLAQPSGPPAPTRVPEINAASVRAVLAARRLRDESIGPALGEVAWALLLDAFAARLEGRGVAMTNLGTTAGIARSTAHRRAAQLLDRGLLVRHDGASDDRTVLVTLSDDCAGRVHAYLAKALKLSPWLV
jgi:hypothetical protein